MMKLSFRNLWLFLFIIFTPNVFAAASIFTIPQQDVSIAMLNQLFGSMGTLLAGAVTNATPLGIVLSFFNNAVLVLGGIVVLYMVVVSTINTAHEGEMLGKRWNSVWIPIRAALGFALLLPVKTGYAIIQMLVMWFIIQGVGAGDSLWTNTINTLATNAVSPQTPDSLSVNTFNAANLIFTNAVCQYALSDLYTYGTFGNKNPSPATTWQLSSDKTTYTALMGIQGSGLNLNGSQYICGTAAIRLLQNNSSQQQSAENNFKQLVTTLQTDAKNDFWNLYHKQSYISPQQSSVIQQDIQNATKAYLQTIVNNVRSTYAPPAGGGQLPAIDTSVLIQNGWITAGSFYLTFSRVQNAPLSMFVAPSVTPMQMGRFETLWGSPKDSGYQSMMTAITVTYKSTCFASGAPVTAQTTNYCIPPSVTDLKGGANSGGGSYGGSNNSNIVLQIAPPEANTPIATVVLKPLIEMVNAALLGEWTRVLEVGTISIISGPVAAALIPGFSAPSNAFNGILSQSNPIPSLMHWGYDLLTGISDLFSILILAIFVFGLMANICNCMNPVGYAFTSALGVVVPFIAIIIGGIWLYGSIVAYYIPLIPYMVFVLGGIAWLILVIEAMVAAPIMALGILQPEGHDIFGHSTHGLMILVNVFLRPSLMIVGFWASYMMVSVTVSLINAGFLVAIYNIAAMTAGSAVTSTGTKIGYITLWGALSFIGIYILLVLIAINKAFSLIYILPDRILRWLGVGPEDSGVAQELQSLKQGYEQQTKAVEQAGTGALGGQREATQAYQQTKEDAAKKAGGGGVNFS